VRGRGAISRERAWLERIEVTRHVVRGVVRVSGEGAGSSLLRGLRTGTGPVCPILTTTNGTGRHGRQKDGPELPSLEDKWTWPWVPTGARTRLARRSLATMTTGQGTSSAPLDGYPIPAGINLGVRHINSAPRCASLSLIPLIDVHYGGAVQGRGRPRGGLPDNHRLVHCESGDGQVDAPLRAIRLLLSLRERCRYAGPGRRRSVHSGTDQVRR
jgi:hypothetical protein